MPSKDQKIPTVRYSTHSAEPSTLTVLTQVRELIVTGEFAAGSRLTADAIAKELGVSRTPVRSALAILAAEGLASYEVNRGYAVQSLDLRAILDAIEVRAVLEARGAGLAVDYGWLPNELERLKQSVDEGAAIIERGQWSEEIERKWYEANRDFHSLIVRVSRNAAIRTAIRMTLIYPVFGDIARNCPAVSVHVPQRYRTIPEAPPPHIVESQRDHEDILAAVANEDAELVEKLMLDHVIKSKDRLVAIATRR